MDGYFQTFIVVPTIKLNIVIYLNYAYRSFSELIFIIDFVDFLLI